MATNHDVWDAVAATDGSPAQSYEMLLDIFMNGTPKRTADIADLNPAFTAKNRDRNTYASKGVNLALKYGDDLVLSWNHEVIRDANGAYQPELQALINAARQNGAGNIMRLRVYDALGADYAFDALFSIAVTRQGTGWDDKAWMAITATQYKFTPGWVTNPVIAGNVPQIEDVSPANAAAGSTIYVQGSNFTGITGASNVKVGTANATSYAVISDTLISLVVPAGAAGATTVSITNANGTATSNYTRG